MRFRTIQIQVCRLQQRRHRCTKIAMFVSKKEEEKRENYEYYLPKALIILPKALIVLPKGIIVLPKGIIILPKGIKGISKVYYNHSNSNNGNK